VAAVVDTGVDAAARDLTRLDPGHLRPVLDGLAATSTRLDLSRLVLLASPTLIGAEGALTRGPLLAKAVSLTRELVDARGSQCTPRLFSEAARRVAVTRSWDCRPGRP
jgi:hypothetical protein